MIKLKPDFVFKNSFDGFRTFCFGLLWTDRECRDGAGTGDVQAWSDMGSLFLSLVVIIIGGDCKYDFFL